MGTYSRNFFQADLTLAVTVLLLNHRNLKTKKENILVCIKWKELSGGH